MKIPDNITEFFNNCTPVNNDCNCNDCIFSKFCDVVVGITVNDRLLAYYLAKKKTVRM